MLKKMRNACCRSFFDIELLELLLHIKRKKTGDEGREDEKDVSKHCSNKGHLIFARFSFLPEDCIDCMTFLL